MPDVDTHRFGQIGSKHPESLNRPPKPVWVFEKTENEKRRGAHGGPPLLRLFMMRRASARGSGGRSFSAQLPQTAVQERTPSPGGEVIVTNHPSFQSSVRSSSMSNGIGTRIRRSQSVLGLEWGPTQWRSRYARRPDTFWRPIFAWRRRSWRFMSGAPGAGAPDQGRSQESHAGE